jgi:CheY-like chemotaxis protein
MPVILLDDPTSDKYRVLVCDDAALNRKVVTRCLQDKGHHCIEAENGLAAVEIFGDGVERANIDVVLIGVQCLNV